MDYLRAIQLKAMRSVVRPGDLDFFIRRVLRWYSKNFHTPLATVEELPLEDVLLTWYEEQYMEMSHEEREQTLQRLLLSEEEFHEMIVAEEIDDAEMFEMGKMEAAAQAEAQKNRKLTPTVPALGPITQRELPETVLGEGVIKSGNEPPPEISMTFVDPAEFTSLLEDDAIKVDGE